MNTELHDSPKLEDIEIPDIPEYIEKQREFFQSGATQSYEFRKNQLQTLHAMISENQGAIVEAIQKDMGRPFFEAYGADIGIVLKEIRYALKRLKKWIKPEKVGTGLALFKSSAHIESIPYGVALVVSAWNYPVFTLIRPLVSVLAAGNTAILKPSEYSVATSKLIDNLVNQYFDSNFLEVIQGGVETGQELLQQKFDLIVFTGSTRVGKLYAEAAAKNLTPIILELGGKSPTIVGSTAKLDLAAERILLGKFVNASQTCIAADYVLVHDEVKDDLIEQLKIKLLEAYGEDPQTSNDYARIINNGQFNRIKSIYDELDDSKTVIGGEFDKDKLYISPTIIDSPDINDMIMQEEIFGPLLPLIPFKDLDEVREIVDENPDPLAMYIFSEDNDFVEALTSTIRSGDLAINSVALHGVVAGLKFGGIGTSGMRGYGGKYGFDQCSHKRSVFKKSTFFTLPFDKPPYTSFKDKLLKLFLK